MNHVDLYNNFLEVLTAKRNENKNFEFSAGKYTMGTSHYISIFDLSYTYEVKIRFADHSVTNTHRVLNEVHNPTPEIIDDLLKKIL